MKYPPRHPAQLGERLSPRARVFLLITASQHAAMGFYALTRPDLFGSESFDGIKDSISLLMPAGREMFGWGVVLTAIAALCILATITGRDGQARAALLGSVVLEGAWLGGYIATIAAGTVLSPVGIIVWGALIGRDLTMLRNPLKNPFEPLIRRLVDDPHNSHPIPHDAPA